MCDIDKADGICYTFYIIHTRGKMKQFFTKILKSAPGVALSLLIAALATFIESILPIHVIGAAVMAMFIGMLLNHLIKNKAPLALFVTLPKRVWLNTTKPLHKCFCVKGNCKNGDL